MFELEVFVLKLSSVNRSTAGPVVIGEIAALSAGKEKKVYDQD
jgi:hypothetical protein